jgi:putative PIN family toxin of toxin-antitoxin system
MKRSIQKIVSISKIVIPTRKINVVQDDPDDNKILECAIAGNVDYLVTQDKHLLNLKEFEGIKIITPDHLVKFLSRLA